MEHKRHERADESLLKTIDAVLEQVQGSFTCAAKLCDMTYARLKNIVNGNPRLKLKFGKGKGRPKGLRFELRIKPYVAPKPYLEPWRADLLLESKGFIMHFSPAQLDELAAWLEWYRSQRGLQPQDQQSLAEWSQSAKAA